MKLLKIRQNYPPAKIGEVKKPVTQLLHKQIAPIDPGSRIAVAIGSRGIADLAIITKTVIKSLKNKGIEPFIIPAMGSHGGATAAGQKQTLANLGMTEKTMGVPIKSSMEVVEISSASSMPRVFMDKLAFQADGVVLINRIKPHTDFHGSYESGLVKMTVVGLGKHRQALELHRYGIKGLQAFLPKVAEKVLATGKVLFGVAIVENARDETMAVRILAANEFLKKEPELLTMARENMPCLPVEKIDVLIVDQMGKDISGTGLDPNIIGRTGIAGQEWPGGPEIKSIMVTDLSSATHGNASGMGLADVITRKLYQKIDFSATYENVITSTFLQRARVPLIADNARKAFQIACRAAVINQPGRERVMRIRNTLHLQELYVSRSIFEQIKNQVEIVQDFTEIFSTSGELADF